MIYVPLLANVDSRTLVAVKLSLRSNTGKMTLNANVVEVKILTQLRVD